MCYYQGAVNEICKLIWLLTFNEYIRLTANLYYKFAIDEVTAEVS